MRIGNRLQTSPKGEIKQFTQGDLGIKGKPKGRGAKGKEAPNPATYTPEQGIFKLATDKLDKIINSYLKPSELSIEKLLQLFITDILKQRHSELFNEKTRLKVVDYKYVKDELKIPDTDIYVSHDF